MSLFTSATSGVDPQTGSYLSKEQRVAMFQSSRGRGGGGSAAPESGRGRVAPQNAIVVANKMAAVVQTLQTNTQETVQAVNVKVQENAQNIENLYRSVQNNRSAEAKEEKAETKLLRGERETALRSGKEKLIEGMSSAVAGLANMGRKAADAAMTPVMGFWDKIKQFLLLLGGAWVIENLPSIIDSVKDFVSWLGDFKSWLPKSLTGLRGVWSIADNIIRSMWRGFSRIAGTVFRIATWIGGQIYRLASKIFKPIGSFIVKLVKKLVTTISDALGGAMRAAGNALKGLVPGGATPTPGGAAPQLPGAGGTGGKAVGEVADETGGNLLTRALRAIKKMGKSAFDVGKGLLDKGGAAINSGLGKIQETTTGVKPQGTGAHKTWISNALEPIISKFPQMTGALKGIGNFMGKITRFIPGIGFAIDLAMNKGVAGQDWTEAIMRALPSSVAGGLSAGLGAKIGGGIGAGLGAAALGIGAIPGGIIGAALGALIAGIAGGYVGDQLGASAYEGITGETRTENRPENQAASPIQAPGEKSDNGLEYEPSSSASIQIPGSGTDGLKKTATSGSSTPDGMTEPDGGGSSSMEVVDLPAKVIDSGGDESKGKVEFPTSIEETPFWQTADPAADAYRNYARQEFELVY